MGVEAKKAPPLPAPTETDSASATGTELATEVSRVTDKTSYSIPEDGSPVTISTRRKATDNNPGEIKIGRNTHQSQTSLLIEYFEGGKNDEKETRRPSVRVKVTPSSKSRSRSGSNHIQITETSGNRKASRTKRISLSPNVRSDKLIEGESDDKSLSSYASATELSNATSRGDPIEIEVMPRRHGSPLIPTGESSSHYVKPNASEISSMPADSFLDGQSSVRSPRRESRDRVSKGETVATGAAAGLATAAAAAEAADTLKTPSRRRSRSLSRERIVAQKVAERVRGEKSERRRKHSSRSRSVSTSDKRVDEVKSPRRRSSRHNEESVLSGQDSSLLTTSQVSGSRRSGDQSSVRSGASKSSLNNIQFLEAVEDAVRRLLPGITELKREQSKHGSRNKSERERRDSVTSGSGVSQETRDEHTSSHRLSHRSSGPNTPSKPKVTLNDTEVLSGNSVKGRKEKKSHRELKEDASRSFERAESDETVVRDDDKVHKKKSRDHHDVEALAAGGALGALTASALHKHDSKDSLGERKERRRRRTKSRSRSDSLAESYEEASRHEVPPMPLMSDINSSELTRTSILSADTERPRSASEEHTLIQVHDVPRGFASPSSQTPTLTPNTLQRSLGTQHGNFSRGDLSLRSHNNSEQEIHAGEYELDEHGRKVPMHEHDAHSLHEEVYSEGEPSPSREHAEEEEEVGGAALGAGLAAHHLRREDNSPVEEEYDSYYGQRQEVPHPLRYVPYAEQKRGLSPIQSVSSWREDDIDENPRQRDSRLTRSIGSYSSLDNNGQRHKSYNTLSSTRNSGLEPQLTNKHDFAEVRHGGLTDSELTQEGDYWEEDQQKDNDQNRSFDNNSYRDSDSHMDYKHRSAYTDESVDAPYAEDRLDAGQNVRGVGANPNFVHTPMGVESAVASLVDASVLTAGSGKSGSKEPYDRRASYASYEEGSERHFTSRGNSPTKQQNDNREVAYDEETNGEYASQSNSPIKHAQEYELDEYGRKYNRPRSEFTEGGETETYDGEYELDEQGRKITMPSYNNAHSRDAGTAALAGAAAGIAAMAAADEHHGGQEYGHHEVSEIHDPTIQKSFKERAMEGQGQSSPRHSVDRSLAASVSNDQFKMSASGIPTQHNAMPEIGYGDEESEVTTNPSIIHGRAGNDVSHDDREQWSAPQTPTQTRPNALRSHNSREANDSGLKAAKSDLMEAAVAAGAAAAIVGHNRDVDYDDVDVEWQRTSEDRKRDTLVTNPFEDASPVAAQNRLDGNIPVGAGFPALNHDFSASKARFQDNGSPALRDEGYMSSAPNAQSPGLNVPGQREKFVDFMDQDSIEGATNAIDTGDPFTTPKHNRQLSGMSHGMGSPLYDAATGNGIDRIQSKDIVALMDHLTVRDAQRSARDTEILVTLVRAAAEMRNSFEDMKKLLAETEDVVITEVQRNTDRSLLKAINGPRPPPQSAPRSLRQGSHDDMVDDIPSKRKNVFQRALKGLSMRSSNDLAKIEDMLVQLLGEVEGLKAAQGLQQRSINQGESYDDLDADEADERDHGYEPEGNAGTSTASHASQSGHFSLPLSRGTSANRPYDTRKFSDHRISTVPEGDEEGEGEEPEEDEIDEHEQTILDNQFENNERLLTPTRETVARGGSAPLRTPPQQQQYVAPAPLSSENTPKTDKSKKHKSSGSSGLIPRISRWSETTASTVARGFRSSGRSSGRKETNSGAAAAAAAAAGADRYASPTSPRFGGSEGTAEHNNRYEDDDNNNFVSDKLHSGFSREDVTHYQNSNNSGGSERRLEEDGVEDVDYDDTDAGQHRRHMQATLAPPAPHMGAGGEEDPKYQVHRNSLNLQHPQPRPGPTHRYQTALESQAQTYDTPMSPKSVEWGSSTSVNRLPPQQQQQQQRSSGGGGGGGGGGHYVDDMDDAGYLSHGSAPGPPRPPKEPLTQHHQAQAAKAPRAAANKLKKPSPLSNEHLAVDSSPRYGGGSVDGGVGYAGSPDGSPRPAQQRAPSGLLSAAVPARKPLGPRSLSSTSRSGGELNREDGTVRRSKNRDTFGTVGSYGSGESETF